MITDVPLHAFTLSFKLFLIAIVIILKRKINDSFIHSFN